MAEFSLWAPAEAALVAARARLEESAATDSEDYRDVLVELSKAYLGQDRLREAEHWLARAEASSLEANGADSAKHMTFLREVAVVLSRQGFDAQAVPLLRRAIEGYARLGDGEILSRRVVEGSLARALTRLGQTEEALSIARDALEFWLVERGDSHRETGWARFTLGAVLLARGETAAAEAELREALDVLRRNSRETESPVLFAQAEAALARCLTIRGDHREAETLLAGAYERIEEHGKDAPRVREEIVNDLVALYETWGKPTEVARWRGQAAAS